MIKMRDEINKYNLVTSELPIDIYQIDEPYRTILYGDKKPKGKPRPKIRGGQNRNRRDKKGRKPKH